MPAEKKEHKIVSASTGAQMTKEEAAASAARAKKAAAPVGNATPYRIGAIVLWVLAIGFEVLAVLVTFGKIDLKFMSQIAQLILFLVLDLAAVIVGAQLWKKANHIDPASKKNKTKFWLWNNMGLIVAIFAFVPLIILLLTNKNLDKKTRTIAVIAACAALLIGGAASIDYNPVSAEEKQVAEANITGEVCWTRYGKVYHVYVDDETWCQHLNNSDEVWHGTVEEAIAAGKTRLCKTCAHNHGLEGIEDLPLSD